MSSLYNKLVKYPFGREIFSFLFCTQAPYFLGIRPLVQDMKPGFGTTFFIHMALESCLMNILYSIVASVSMKQRWGVQNHIKTVHAIAVCNLVEMTMGIVAEATIPPHLRWLPMGMDVSYLKKATGRLEATSTIDPATFFELPKYPGEVKVPVDVKNAEGVLVTKAEVRDLCNHLPFSLTNNSQNNR